MINLNLFISLLVILITLIAFGKITKTINDNIEKNFKSDYLKYGFLSRYYLAKNLTPLEFEDFCKDILKDMGYKNLENFSESFEGGINLCSTNKNKRTYISAKLYGLIKNEDEEKLVKENVNDEYEKVGRPEAQKFIGALVHDEVKNGIIITTGDFTDEAKQYIESLPEDFSIILIDGISLTNKLRNIREKEIMIRIALDESN